MRRAPSVSARRRGHGAPRSDRDRGGLSLADDLIKLLVHRLGQNTEPDTDDERTQSFLRGTDELAEYFRGRPPAWVG